MTRNFKSLEEDAEDAITALSTVNMNVIRFKKKSFHGCLRFNQIECIRIQIDVIGSRYVRAIKHSVPMIKISKKSH